MSKKRSGQSAVFGGTTEQLANYFDVHRNTIARWQRSGLLPGGQRARHPSGRGWTTLYGSDVFSRIEVIKRLTASGTSLEGLKAALQHFEDTRRPDVRAQAIATYDAWSTTWPSDSVPALEGTTSDITHAGGVVRDRFPLSMHIPAAVRRTLQQLGLSPERCEFIASRVDAELVRDAIAKVYTGFAPVLVCTGTDVFVAPEVALPILHRQDNPPPGRTADDTASTFEAHWWTTQAPGYITIKLYPILVAVWNAWGKEPAPTFANYPTAVLRTFTHSGDEMVDYDCALDVPGSGRMVGIGAYPVSYTARLSPTTKNPEYERLRHGTHQKEARPRRKRPRDR
jgi:DNA-binding transcriptional MerR regulator